MPWLIDEAPGRIMTDSSRLRCGQVWGTGCQAWVDPPEYTHGTHPDVRRATRSLQCSELGMLLLSKKPTGKAAWRLANHPALPPAVVDSLASHKHRAIRYRLALNPCCGAHHLQMLSRDRSRFVRQAVAGRADCPQDTLLRLMNDPDPQVRRAAGSNPNLPEEYRALINIARINLLSLSS